MQSLLEHIRQTASGDVRITVRFAELRIPLDSVTVVYRAKFDIMATATEAGDESVVSLNTIGQLARERCASVDTLMDLCGGYHRIMEATG
jgi:hypothetical protein